MDYFTDFDNIIKNLHGSPALTDNKEDDKNVIVINEKRQFIPGSNFNTIIAYEGDVNSQIITFKLLKAHDNHDLSKCGHKEIKWKNIASGVEGTSYPEEEDAADVNYFYLKWLVPAEVCTQSGNVEISLSIYDKTGDKPEDKIAFSWNTAKYAGLSIGSSIESVGENFPPKDEILVINKDTKAITAPVGYNNTICNYGEVGLTEIYFLVDRYLGKKKTLDVLSANTTVTIYVTMNGLAGYDNTDNVTKELYTVKIDEDIKEGLVLITWKVPNGVTSGVSTGPVGFSIMVGFEDREGNRWFSNTYSNLKVGSNLYNGSIEEPSKWDVFEDYVGEAIKNFFEENNFVLDAN